MLKISVTGQDTLAAAVRECCGRHFDIIDPSAETDILYCCDDTPIGFNGRPDWGWVLNRIVDIVPRVSKDTLILISSQLPVGSMRRIESVFKKRRFAYSPENIRVATAVADFENQARIIVGTRTRDDHDRISELFGFFTKNIIFTDPESAECAKHFLNCWLGLSIAFINEAARFCKEAGADPELVSKALLTDQRVSPKAPLRPGAPFGGGHLARDIFTVNDMAGEFGIKLPLISHIMESNQHKA